MKAEEIKKRAVEAEGKLKSHDIPAWGVKVFFTPITVADEQYISQRTKDMGDETTYAVELIALKCLDGERQRIWTTDEDREFLRSKVNRTRIRDLVIAIGAAGVEASKKNSKTPRS